MTTLTDLQNVLFELKALRSCQVQEQRERALQVGRRLSDAVLSLSSKMDAQTVWQGVGDALLSLLSDVDEVGIAVTGLAWLGEGVPAVDRVMADILDSARKEILITAYAITEGSGGVLEALRRAVRRGVRCSLIINRLRSQPIASRTMLRSLCRDHPYNFQLFDFSAPDTSELHAKTLVADDQVAVVGSANLTWQGMTAGHELSVVVRGPASCIIAERIRKLLFSGFATRMSYSDYPWTQ